MGGERGMKCFLRWMCCAGSAEGTHRASVPKHAVGWRLRKNYEVSMRDFRSTDWSIC